MAGPTDVYASLLEVLDARLRDPAPPGREPPDQDPDPLADRDRLARLRLEADRVETRLHSRITSQPVTYGVASFCAECGEPAPCPTIRRLAEQHDVTF